MILECCNKRILLSIDEKIEIETNNIKFWLERFCPSIKIFNENDSNYDWIIECKNNNINSIIESNKKYILYGKYENNSESFIAKFITQVFSKLIIEDGYLIVPAACVKNKENDAVLIMGDFGQGKTSVASELAKNKNFEIISDNYVIIKENKIVGSTKHLSIRKENINFLNENKRNTLFEKNNRFFYERENNEIQKCSIAGIVIPYINNGDKNFHLISDEEKIWFLYGKLSRIFNGETVLFNGSVPSPILNNTYISERILNITNALLKDVYIHYLSSSLESIAEYINKKILYNKIDYNFIVKLTTACPGSCKCCKNRKENFKLKNTENSFFDLDTFEKICEGIVKLGGKYVALSGGEPTIVPDFEKYIEIASKYGLTTRLNTNGWNISEENLEKWLDLGLDQVVLSVYGVDESIAMNLRGNSEIYNRTMKAIEIIKNVKKEKDFIFILQTVIMKENYREIPKILKLAIESGADIFWPSYLEDAYNLPEIRLDSSQIEDFRENIIPQMKNIVNNLKIDSELKAQINQDVEKIYNNSYDAYIYHLDNANCPWPGKHFTFYPNGTIDPCPGHEYFKSEYQWICDYNNIEGFFKDSNLKKNILTQYDYCKYCPQGEHKAIRLTINNFHEHSKKGE